MPSDPRANGLAGPSTVPILPSIAAAVEFLAVMPDLAWTLSAKNPDDASPGFPTRTFVGGGKRA